LTVYLINKCDQPSEESKWLRPERFSKRIEEDKESMQDDNDHNFLELNKHEKLHITQNF
jgi:hypothetical protein